VHIHNPVISESTGQKFTDYRRVVWLLVITSLVFYFFMNHWPFQSIYCSVGKNCPICLNWAPK
jgi:hypothetical protein